VIELHNASPCLSRRRIGVLRARLAADERVTLYGPDLEDPKGDVFGVTRTLTLLDGRRFTPSGPTGQVDVNLMPQGLVDRVDVVNGGASAAYGSDAVGGVVNFVLNKEFVGFKSDFLLGDFGMDVAQPWGESWHGIVFRQTYKQLQTHRALSYRPKQV
jgi:hypothetical protein